MMGELSIAPINGGEGMVEYSVEDLARIEDEAALASSRRLREKIGSARAIELLEEEISAADEAWTDYVRASNGEWQTNGFELDVKGFEIERWFDWIGANLDDESMHFSVHPEHYAWTTIDALGEDPALGHHVIVEPIGDMMLRFYVRDGDWSGIEEHFDEEYPHRGGVTLALRNGTVVGKSLSQAKVTDDGYRFRFTVFKPAALPAEDVVSHLDHAVVEYIHYMERAAEGSRA
jgi:hypothetical protein